MPAGKKHVGLLAIKGLNGVHEFSLRQGTILLALIEAYDFIIKTPNIS